MTDVWDDIAAEFLHLYRRGFRLLAVSGADGERSRLAADDLAAALIGAGQRVERAHAPDGSESALRDDLVAPLRASDPGDLVLLVSGPAALLGQGVRGMWNFAVWQLAGEEAPHTVAAAIVDVTDPGHPTRRFADFCALPASYGA